MKNDAIDNRITFRLPLDLIAEFKERCDVNNLSRSKILRSLVDGWVEQQRENADV